jgi:hypothetical protein
MCHAKDLPNPRFVAEQVPIQSGPWALGDRNGSSQSAAIRPKRKPGATPSRIAAKASERWTRAVQAGIITSMVRRIAYRLVPFVPAFVAAVLLHLALDGRPQVRVSAVIATGTTVGLLAARGLYTVRKGGHPSR